MTDYADPNPNRRRTSWTRLGLFAAGAFGLAFLIRTIILNNVTPPHDSWTISAETEGGFPCSVIVTTHDIGRPAFVEPQVRPWENGSEPWHQIARYDAEQRGVSTYRSDQVNGSNLRIAQGTGLTTVVVVKVVRNGEEFTTHMRESLGPRGDFRIRVADNLRVSIDRSDSTR